MYDPVCLMNFETGYYFKNMGFSFLGAEFEAHFELLNFA